jgi:ATP adenylyltransferase
MERLWAPWRMSYIAKLSDPSECFLCVAAADPAKDDENFVIWRGEHSFCIVNLYPYNNGHLMVAPFRHDGDPGALTRDESADLWAGIVRAQRLLKKVMNPQGFNIGMNIGKTAGAGVAEHLHVHLVPRWEGDTNYMPVLADTKIVPQALSDLYKQLRAAVAEMDKQG